MTLQKGFLHRKLLFSEIPVTRKYIGPFMGVLVAITFYALLYFCRDICRDLSARQPEFFWELTNEELNFYNFFYAAISSLLGQSVCFNIWFYRSRQMFSLPALFRIRILNDQNVLIWYFLAWFGKLAFVFWIFFGLTFWGGHYIFSFYPDYKLLFYLVLAVLFLQSWNSFRQLFAQQSLKWMLTSVIILGLFSLALSRVNFKDQEAFQKRKQEGSVYHKYDFELPRTAYYRNDYNAYLAAKIKVVIDSSKVKEPYSIFIEGQSISLEGVSYDIQQFVNDLNEAERHYAFTQLYIDSRVAISFVEKVKEEVARAGIRKVFYMVVPENPEYDVRYYNNLGIPDRVQVPNPLYSIDTEFIVYNGEFIPSPPPVVIKQLKINTEKFDQASMARTLQLQMDQKPDRIIRYSYNPTDNFSKYIKVLSAAHIAIDNQREEEALQKYQKSFNDLPWQYQMELESKYSLHFQAAPKEK